MSNSRPQRRLAPRGYTLVELIIALVLGVMVLSAAIAFLITQLRTLEGSDVREDVARNGRYVGVSLRRDVQRAGIDIESTESFGTVMVMTSEFGGDQLVLLHVPYVPSPAPPHDLDPNATGNGDPPPTGEGTCGLRCLELLTDTSEPLEIENGDLARLQVDTERRLILVSNEPDGSSSPFQLEFHDHDEILTLPAGLDGLQLDMNSTFVQKLVPTIYYLDDQDRLIRAVELDQTGSPVSENAVLAYGVEEFDISLIFEDGDELEVATPGGADNSDDYDDIVAVRARVTVKADRVDPRVNQGELLRKTYEWTISPRNLRYEKNR